MPDFTGGLAPAITAFGSNVLPGIIDKLTAAGATDEAAALQSFHDTLTGGISQAGSVIQADLSAAIDRIDAVLTKQREALFADLDARLPAAMPLWNAPKTPKS